MMTLLIQPYLKTRRHYLQKKLNSSRRQLIEAYKSKDPRRIMKGKLTLARILRELAESPELGPKRQFQWGLLEVVYQFGFDEKITWEACKATESDMQKVAQLLESSIVYE